jgi:hypothetical protein
MELLQALIGQGHSKQDALEIIRGMKERLNEGEDPEELLYEEGLEPDYVMDLLY